MATSLEKRDCKQCSKPFKPVNHAQVYCGNDCFFAAKAARHKAALVTKWPIQTPSKALAEAQKQAAYLTRRLADHRTVLADVEAFLVTIDADPNAAHLLDDVREIMHGAAKRVHPRMKKR